MLIEVGEKLLLLYFSSAFLQRLGTHWPNKFFFSVNNVTLLICSFYVPESPVNRKVRSSATVAEEHLLVEARYLLEFTAKYSWLDI